VKPAAQIAYVLAVAVLLGALAYGIDSR